MSEILKYQQGQFELDENQYLRALKCGSRCIEIVYKSFELNPSADHQNTTNTRERISEKYGISIEKAQQMIDQISDQAKRVGLDFNYDTVRYTNTFDAHRLAKYAETKGKGLEISEKLLYAYFTENKQMSDYKVLTDIASESGLDRLETEAILNSNLFADKVRMDEADAQSRGIRSVPYFVINEKYVVSGAQEPKVFEEIIKKVLAEQ